jgi:hypothetical protein
MRGVKGIPNEKSEWRRYKLEQHDMNRTPNVRHWASRIILSNLSSKSEFALNCGTAVIQISSRRRYRYGLLIRVVLCHTVSEVTFGLTEPEWKRIWLLQLQLGIWEIDNQLSNCFKLSILTNLNSHTLNLYLRCPIHRMVVELRNAGLWTFLLMYASTWLT